MFFLCRPLPSFFAGFIEACHLSVRDVMFLVHRTKLLEDLSRLGAKQTGRDMDLRLRDDLTLGVSLSH